MHILLVRFSSMGDVVLQTATINWLRSRFPEDLKLTFLTSKEFVSLVDGHPGLDGVISFDRRGGEKWTDLKKKIKDLDVDLILDLHATLRSARIKLSFWSTPSLTVDKRRWERFLLVKFKGIFFKRLIDPKFFGLEAQVERIIKDIENIFGGSGGIWKTKDLRNGPHREMTSLNQPDLYELPGPYIVIAPSASFFYKRWPVDSFVQLTRDLLATTSYHLVVLAGPEDVFCESFNEIETDRLHNLQGKTKLAQSMSILSKAKLCIGNDSGMNHIAESYGVSCLTIFGPTDPRFGFAPHGESSRYLSKELWCKPCSTTGKKECFRDRHYCMEMITPDEVRTTAMKILEAQ